MLWPRLVVSAVFGSGVGPKRRGRRLKWGMVFRTKLKASKKSGRHLIQTSNHNFIIICHLFRLLSVVRLDAGMIDVFFVLFPPILRVQALKHIRFYWSYWSGPPVMEGSAIVRRKDSLIHHTCCSDNIIGVQTKTSNLIGMVSNLRTSDGPHSNSNGLQSTWLKL